jgi:hypothetical protein
VALMFVGMMRLKLALAKSKWVCDGTWADWKNLLPMNVGACGSVFRQS